MQPQRFDVDPRPEPLMTIAEIAQHTRLSERTIRRAIATGAFPTIRVGRTIRVRTTDLNAFLQSHLDRRSIPRDEQER